MIKSPTTKTTIENPPVVVPLDEIETTHLVMNFSTSTGFVRQVYRKTGGNVAAVRFLKITGNKYTNFVGNSIINKVQALNDLDENAVGLNIDEISRQDFLEQMRQG